MEAFLDALVNHERSGVPAGAGVAGPAGFNLARMRRLLTALGEPHQQLKVVHVAGARFGSLA